MALQGVLADVQREGDLADSAAYENNFVEALKRYRGAAEGARKGVELARQSGKNVEEKLFLKLLQRYEEKEMQLKRMIDSPDESSLVVSRAPSIAWDAKYESLLRDDDDEAAADPHTWDTLLWGGINRLMHIFSPFTSQKSPSDKAVSADLEESFVLVHNSPVKQTQSSFDATEISRMREEIALLKNENEQLRKSIKSNSGVNEVVAENNQLKQSIMLFQSEVQKHTNLIRERQNKSMMLSQTQAGKPRNDRSTFAKPNQTNPSTLSPITEVNKPSMSSQVTSLLAELKSDLKSSKSFALVEELEKRFAEQEAQINELRRYKEKWRNLKRDARKNATALSSSPSPSQGLDLSSSSLSTSSVQIPAEKKA